MRVLYRSHQDDRLRVMLVLVHIDITLPHTPLPVFRQIGERTIPYSWRVSTRRLLGTDHVILNDCQVTWTTPELVPPLLRTTPLQREDVSALDRFSVHRCPTRRVFSGTGLELVIKPATIRYLYHSATTAPYLFKSQPLRFINRHGKCQSYKELHSFRYEWHIRLPSSVQCDP
ncbi:uncharacterized protein TNCV_1490701 [Trichonephila clavipes]|nr:uncharacterized protein TNCV_1490701 [Trichonephila clavipes]